MVSSDRKLKNLANRRELVKRIRSEIVGPDPHGDVIEIANHSAIGRVPVDRQDAPRKLPNGEEILWQDPPYKRYGAGILYPPQKPAEVELSSPSDEEDKGLAMPEKDVDVDGQADRRSYGVDDSDDFGINLANAYKPSAIGVSFMAELDGNDREMCVKIADAYRLGRSDNDIELHPSATYVRHKYVLVKKDQSTQKTKKNEDLVLSQWLRIPYVSGGQLPEIKIGFSDLLNGSTPIRVAVKNAPVDLQIIVVSRKIDTEQPLLRLITVTLLNRSSDSEGSGNDLPCLYQSGIHISTSDGKAWIRPYPEESRRQNNSSPPMSEAQVNRLLFRREQTYAIGHGCAADWINPIDSRVSSIWSDVMPLHETVSTSTDLTVKNNDGVDIDLRVSMRKLSGLDTLDNGRIDLEAMIRGYEDWIDELKVRVTAEQDIHGEFSETALGLIKRCDDCLGRIRDGLDLLNGNDERAEKIKLAFRFANEAMLLARSRSAIKVRSPQFEGLTYKWDHPFSPVVHDEWGAKQGYWRPFQIAFLLMSLRGIVDENHDDRVHVDLIWFPTGGGKTEAYLGVTAFTIIFNRLSGRRTTGADVLMRYTLRLLTAQQFQRAALLFCSMEWIRKRNSSLGNEPFDLGLWVGGETTPNTRDIAISKLNGLKSKSHTDNPFVLLKCPWCGAKFGRFEVREKGARTETPIVLGYVAKGSGPSRTVIFSCPDRDCDFYATGSAGNSRDPLPVKIIDEDLIEYPPRMIIGTVDKFAMLAWKPELRRLFGINRTGQHDQNPPTLIIQDELHLISGPLGSMVGAYETVVEAMCRHHGNGDQKPKIIASTATICNAEEQIRSLYARHSSSLFPPSGLEGDDSFFSKTAKDQDGPPSPGRMYLGIMAPGHGSLQTTQARAFSSAVQFPVTIDGAEERDPWWTLLCFYNSIRELGGAQSLFVSDVKQYLGVIQSRRGDAARRFIPPPAELTSRIRSDEVPKELERLEVSLSERMPSKAVDVCLASNIIEVGVDVGRLGLMAIVGQPKTTSQYIQVSSRVGRDINCPGLVLMLYGQGKPRDRSHYERFKPYHQKLYAHVEPTSVTPFSLPAIDRALHGLVIALVRQLSDLTNRADDDARPFPLAEGEVMRDLILTLLRDRVSIVDPQMIVDLEKRVSNILAQWKKTNPLKYGNFGFTSQDPPLMYQAGSFAPEKWKGSSFATLSSLRNVDASCEASVTMFFNKFSEESA